MPRILSTRPAEPGLASDVAREIFAQIAQFAGYGFNKSHAAAYAAIGFRTAWLKTHHPEAFFAAAMNLDLDDVDAIATYAGEIKDRGLTLTKPCVNASGALFRPGAPGLASRRISYGLAALRGLGRTAAEAIVAEREAHGPFASVTEFIRRLGSRNGPVVNKRALQALARAGAFDSVSATRAAALAEIDGGQAIVAEARAGQASFFELMGDQNPATGLPEMDELALLEGEFDVMGFYVSGHPLDALRPRLQEAGLYFARRLKSRHQPPRMAALPAVVARVDLRKTRAGDTMAILTMSDPDGIYEAVVFSEAWTKISRLVKPKTALMLQASIQGASEDLRILVDGAQLIDPTRLDAVIDARRNAAGEDDDILSAA